MSSVALATVVVVAAASVAACGVAADGAPSSPGRIVEALCEARDLARTGDVDGARDVFDDRAHEGLHGWAATLAAADARSAAARLLEDKQRVEAGFADGVPAEVAARRLDRLIDAAAAAGTATGEETGSC